MEEEGEPNIEGGGETSCVGVQMEERWEDRRALLSGDGENG